MPPAQTRPGQRDGAAVPGTAGIVQCAPWVLGLVGKQPLGTTLWGRNTGSSGVRDQTRPPERRGGWGGRRSPGRVRWTWQGLGEGCARRAWSRCESPQSKPTRSSGSRLEPGSALWCQHIARPKTRFAGRGRGSARPLQLQLDTQTDPLPAPPQPQARGGQSAFPGPPSPGCGAGPGREAEGPTALPAADDPPNPQLPAGLRGAGHSFFFF